IARLLAGRHAVTAVETGAEALALVRSGARFDAILCDVAMPGMTGPELIAHIAAFAPALAEHVMYMTGNSLTLDGQVPASAARLEKPFTRAALTAALDAMLAAQD